MLIICVYYMHVCDKKLTFFLESNWLKNAEFLQNLYNHFLDSLDKWE